ncbi:MAG: tRNA (adenosine(37)-N6)-threonylcarbamoyltransferase complex dimerization subunit type 1 TsaB [Leptolyngbyaceae cyanobacterium SM2_5_2]|nr:tRNA (adenosine(37)-N6)-threonylcarbamoyltransferase complex dimerization subunit type 1 TsaB [Leptolyngbyaceae cyanobacterium SM2_5_2]
MVGLAIHTTSPELGLAISNFKDDTRQQSWAFGYDLSTHLHPTLMEFLRPYQWTDLSFLAVARGPGGFTGTRIGVVTARTLAQQLNLPLFGISSLAAMVRWAIDQDPSLLSDPSGVIAVDMKAQRDMRFVAIYRPTATGLTALQPDQVMPPATWETTLASWPTPVTRITAEADQGKTALQVLTLAHQALQQGICPHWSEVLPYYGQHPVDS